MYLHLEHAEQEQAAVPEFTRAPEANVPSLTPSLAHSLPLPDPAAANHWGSQQCHGVIRIN